jgi:uncharacterized Zn finger protein
VSWGEWTKTPRRRAADGIRAETQSGKFGKTWWAQRWIAALERLVDSARLSRGRSYARSGQVVSLDIGAPAPPRPSRAKTPAAKPAAPVTASVSAKVQGSRPKPYSVSISFRRLDDAEWDRVVDYLAAQAIFAARLLAGEMPENVEEAFAAVGLSLFPAAQNDLVTDCSCPDWANPCKHVAAVYYLLGERFDADPFLLFALRGRTREAILDEMRARRGTGEAAPAEEPVVEEPVETAPTLAESLGSFWESAAEPQDLAPRFERPPADALAVKRLGPPTFAGDDGPRLVEWLSLAYRSIGDRARALALGERDE